jgi:hypothetical protein
MILVELWSEDELIDIAFRVQRARMIARTKTVLVYLLARRIVVPLVHLSSARRGGKTTIDTNNNNNG